LEKAPKRRLHSNTPELRQVQDYVAEVMAAAQEEQGDFTEGVPLGFTTRTLIAANPMEELVQAVMQHIERGTFTCKQLENWTTTALYGTLQLVSMHEANTQQAKRRNAIARRIITRTIRQRMLKQDTASRRQVKSIMIAQYLDHVIM
jgi:hypothetical protein